MRKVLWVGDAVQHTGFARITHSVCDRLAARDWDVSVLGTNYHGDPRGRRYPYDIYPVTLGGDPWGLGVFHETLQRVRPAVVIVNNDPWVVVEFLKLAQKAGIPLIGYMPVDAPQMKKAPELNGLALAIWYTVFGQREAELDGYTGASAVIPHGVDTATYFPIAKAEARARMKLPVAPDAFIVGNVNRNSRRKRLDITVRAFAQFWHQAGCPDDAHLYLHTANADDGADLVGLARSRLCRLTGPGRVIFSSTKLQPGRGVTEDNLRLVYNVIDLMLNTGLGEGWGLPHLEGGACRVAQAVTDYSALAEWLADAAAFFPARDFVVTGDGINTLGGAPHVDDVAATIRTYYHDRGQLDALAAAAYARTTEPRFEWDAIVDQFEMAIAGFFAGAAGQTGRVVAA